MIATVTLNPTTDVIARLDALIPGRVLRSKNIHTYPGGKGINTAAALAVLGADVTALGFAGKKNAGEMLSSLKKRGVKPDLIVVPGSNRICLLLTAKNSETVVNSESNIKVSPLQRRALIKKIKKVSDRASAFVFSGSLPLSLPQDFYSDCLRAVKGRAVSILDAHSKNLLHGIKAGPDILKANLQEFESAFSVKLPGNFRHKTFMEFISGLSRKYGIRTVIVTLGKNGSVLYSAGLFTAIKVFHVEKPVSAVGCGDAYSAGLAYGIDKGMDMISCCRLGAAAAAANLSHEGACFIKKKEILKYLPAGFV